MTDFFLRTRLLLGEAVMERLRTARVAVFGVGGVGSWAAEGLVRSGLTHITLVDSDSVEPTNVNRQLMATARTLGRAKVDALKEHLLAVSPGAHIDPRCETYCEATAESFPLESYDYVVDAIDSLPDKALLIRRTLATRATLFASMGAALRTDPTRVRHAEFYRVEGCPLARALRQRFKREGRPERHFQCVFSDEPRHAAAQKGQPNGSLITVTATFGLHLAALVLDDIQKHSQTPPTP